MLDWKNNYYLEGDIRFPERTRKKIQKRKFVPEIYLITFSHNKENLLEILPATVLIQKAAYENCPTIIGMAKGKDCAIDLVKRIIDEVYQNTGAFNVREYMETR